MDANMKDEIQSTVDIAVHKHGVSPDAFIPILLEINKTLGYIPLQALVEAQERLHNPEQRVFVNQGHLFSLASFYHMLSTQPLGRHVVLFCESAPCHVMGGRELWQALQDTLHLEAGQTSPDGKWSLITTSCLGACGVGPLFVVDEDMYGNITPDQVPDILAKYQ